MGHQRNNAISALRAYARDLEATAKGGVVSSVGTAQQDDASAQLSGSGAPHQLAIAAAVACVVLLGGIGIASAVNSGPAADELQAVPVTTQSDSVSMLLARASGGSTAQAIRAFNDLDMSRSASALSSADGTSIDLSPAAQRALEDLIGLVRAEIASGGVISETDAKIAFAISVLEMAMPPPGLDIDNLPPGLGGSAPGQNERWTPLGQTEDFTPPGEDIEKPEHGGGRP